VKKVVFGFSLIWLSCALAASAGFKDTFDSEPADAGSPDGYSLYGDELLDRGVSAKTCVSGKQEAFVVADFTQDKWGLILLHNPGQWTLNNATVSAQVLSLTDFTGKKGVVGFQLIDSDGTVYRTPDDKLLVPTQQWQLFSQPVSDISQEEEPGKNPGLNLGEIVQYGIVFYDRGDTEKAATFFVDDVQGGQGDEQPPPQAGQGASSDSP
jgi:hypothetical protein